MRNFKHVKGILYSINANYLYHLVRKKKNLCCILMNLYRDVSVDCFPVLQDIYACAAFINFLDSIVTLQKEILYIRT